MTQTPTPVAGGRLAMINETIMSLSNQTLALAPVKNATV